MKYVKRNALAGRSFSAFTELQDHLGQWCIEADQRIHGTTHERPVDRFDRDERALLRPLPARPLPRREQRLNRRVANDSLVDVDTVRYSVPHRLVRERVEVLVGDEEVRIFHAGKVVASHARSMEPYSRVVDTAHWEGLWRPQGRSVDSATSNLAVMGRSLEEYAAVIERGAA